MEIKKQTEANKLPVTLKDLLDDLYNKGKDQVREIPKLENFFQNFRCKCCINIRNQAKLSLKEKAEAGRRTA